MQLYKTIYIGEVNWRWNSRADTWPVLLEYYNQNNLSYAFWSYKAAKDEGFGLIYTLKDDINYSNNRSFANLLSDSSDNIMAKFTDIAYKDSDVMTGGESKYYDMIDKFFSGCTVIISVFSQDLFPLFPKRL